MFSFISMIMNTYSYLLFTFFCTLYSILLFLLLLLPLLLLSISLSLSLLRLLLLYLLVTSDFLTFLPLAVR